MCKAFHTPNPDSLGHWYPNPDSLGHLDNYPKATRLGLPQPQNRTWALWPDWALAGSR